LQITKINNWKYLSENLISEIKEIYDISFPEDERRDFYQFYLQNENQNPEFYYALDDNILIGFYTQWTFTCFNYIEHLAINEIYRGRGYGKELIEKIESVSDRLIVLEVELPETIFSGKRIEFYLKAGFNLCEFPYIQPPYGPGKKSVPMNLMTFPTKINFSEFIIIKKTLYQEVYNVQDNEFQLS
jgi:GNAT superfamily N-acetyltransferase